MEDTAPLHLCFRFAPTLSATIQVDGLENEAAQSYYRGEH